MLNLFYLHNPNNIKGVIETYQHVVDYLPIVFNFNLMYLKS
jgi:hypothetical protein